MMLTLINKDLGLNRIVIIGNAILNLAIFVIVTIAIVSEPSNFKRRDMIDAYAVATVWGIGLTCLLASVYGAIAFAQERREGSANFMAMMPLRRGAIVISKLIAAALYFFMAVLANLLILILLTLCDAYRLPLPLQLPPMTDVIPVVLGFASFTMMLFGVSWLLSSFLKSPPIAACVSIASAFLLAVLIELISDRDGRHTQSALYVVYDTVPFLIGVVSFAAGTIYYLKRVEP